tara:strand:+ start:6110 stop:7129 length:1020 start_codon:yes stop_codon:yes gene_type:complete
MAVPDTTTFSLQDVVDEINPTTDDLNDCVSDATTGSYDTNYFTAPATSLLEFRNYGATVTTWADKVEENASSSSYDFDGDVTDFNRAGLFCKPDGTEIYVLNQNDGKIHQWTMSTGHNLSTISYTGSSSDVRTNWAQGGTSGGLWFNATGTRVMIYDHGTSIMYTHTLSTEWDITSFSTTITTTTTFTAVSSYTRISQFGFTDDGKKLIMPHGANSGALLLRLYSLTTGFDTSTIVDLSGDEELSLPALTSPGFNIECACFCYPEDNTGNDWILTVKRDRDGTTEEYAYEQYTGYTSSDYVSYYEGVVGGNLETPSISNNNYLYTVESGNKIRQYDVTD